MVRAFKHHEQEIPTHLPPHFLPHATTECLPVVPGRYLAFQWIFWRLRVVVGLGGLSLADKVIGSE